MAKITSFGLFWRRDEIEWEPGRGKPRTFDLFGRIGENRPSRRICNFRHQQGIYILYDEYGPNYVGLSGRRKDGSALGQRLKEHIFDKHADTWSRFSWFGFDPVSEPGIDGLCEIEAASQLQDDTSVSSSIRDTEALIMQIIMPRNNDAITKFRAGEEWTQIMWGDRSRYLGS